MDNAENNLITIGQLSRKLKISVLWLKQQADKGVLPCMNAGGRLLFNLDAVTETLAKLAAEGDKMSNNQSPEPLRIEPSLLLSFADAAALLGISRALLYSMWADGRLGPQVVKIGRRSLLNRAELEQWVSAGLPPRNVWGAMK